MALRRQSSGSWNCWAKRCAHGVSCEVQLLALHILVCKLAPSHVMGYTQCIAQRMYTSPQRPSTWPGDSVTTYDAVSSMEASCRAAVQPMLHAAQQLAATVPMQCIGALTMMPSPGAYALTNT